MENKEENHLDFRKVSRPFPVAINPDHVLNSGIGMPVMARSEAKAQGLKYYWTGQPCHKGHNSKRILKSGACWACTYLNNKERYEAQKVSHRKLREERRDQKQAYLMSFKEKQTFLSEYAKHGNLHLAARKVKLEIPEIQVQIAKSTEFNNAVMALERRLRESGVILEEKKKIQVQVKYDWDDDKRDLFIRVYVDSGDIAQARDAIGVTSSMLNKELKDNEKFKEALKEATPEAEQALEERAIQLALRGNDKLLALVLKAKKPEVYGDRIKIEQNTTHIVKLPDEQLNARIESLIKKGLVIDAEFTELDADSSELESPGTRRIVDKSGGTGSEAQVQ